MGRVCTAWLQLVHFTVLTMKLVPLELCSLQTCLHTDSNVVWDRRGTKGNIKFLMVVKDKNGKLWENSKMGMWSDLR